MRTPRASGARRARNPGAPRAARGQSRGMLAGIFVLSNGTHVVGTGEQLFIGSVAHAMQPASCASPLASHADPSPPLPAPPSVVVPPVPPVAGTPPAPPLPPEPPVAA